jgi:hypothetical protein
MKAIPVVVATALAFNDAQTSGTNCSRNGKKTDTT